ncbi:MAG: redox-sensing transcriptional repressor Rex [Candidatus Omnitrophica bacterium]|nr:redox-sensing transcriptional repressor Rex [Candidatus Omnitrophota bacterium]MBU2044524.1 redox-sensing transcriptional repressor Rex [Candidatus Omnitrophota bacterium]MBU2251635.1 redox-sensing transcriptional repressor Rex [Candidatus Omnitrophota bacterium]MBU2265715.1 redox-sensing transcriptional repressor Rex [Candidatus Omnitrophota bacterium]
MKKNNIGKNFSLDSIRRLTLYLRNLRKIKKQGIEVISSDKITRLLNVTPSQFRKDLSYFGEFGKRGVGYNVAFLIEEIQKIVGSHIDWNIALVGLGKLGGALLGFEGFSKFNIKIKAVFDSDKKKIGKIKNGIMIEAVDSLRELIKKNKIKVAIISTPPEVAQNIAEQLIDSGVKGILNFAPVVLKVPDNIFVSNVDMGCELESLIFFVKQAN